MGIHSSHTASDEGGWTDPHACLGHLQFMKGTCSTCTINIIMHISQAPCRNQTVSQVVSLAGQTRCGERLARETTRQWEGLGRGYYSPCTASPAGLSIATRSPVNQWCLLSTIWSVCTMKYISLQSNRLCTTPCCLLLSEVLPCVAERLHAGNTHTAVHGDRGGSLQVATATFYSTLRSPTSTKWNFTARCAVRLPPNGIIYVHK